MEGDGSPTPSSEEDIIINVKDIDHSWANSINEELNALPLVQSAFVFTIFRVPSHIRKGREKYYDPYMVAIGPFHHGRKDLQTMEVQKLKYLKDFLARNTNNSLQDYISKLREVEEAARSCYFDHIDLTSEEFVKMLLLDGCFIIEFVLKDLQVGCDGNELRGGNWFVERVMFDLLLLENQIPFSVIDILYKLLVRGIQAMSEKERMTYDLRIVQIISSAMFSGLEVEDDDIYHLLHLSYITVRQLVNDNIADEANTKSPIILSFVNPGLVLSILLKPLRHVLMSIYRTISSKQKCKPLNKATIPCASKLVEHGVKFKSKPTDMFKLTNISFKDGVLEIPKMDINEEYKYSAFNILAFLKCKLTGGQELSSYYRFMDILIDTSKDVEILEEHGIITSYLRSSEDTALFYNQLNDYAAPFYNQVNDYGDLKNEDNDTLPVYEEINKFCNSNWHKYKARLKRDYFSNPWSILSLFAAVILLILTFLQTLFTILK